MITAKKYGLLIASALALVVILGGCSNQKANTDNTAAGNANDMSASVSETKTSDKTSVDADDKKAISDNNTTGLANPLVKVDDISALSSELGLYMIIPENATNPAYFIIDKQVAQATFTLNGTEVCARMQRTATAEDISGMHYTWKTTKEMALGDYPYTIAYNEGAQGVASWYDEASGVSYSVSVEQNASEDFLASLANTLIPVG